MNGYNLDGSHIGSGIENVNIRTEDSDIKAYYLFKTIRIIHSNGTCVECICIEKGNLQYNPQCPQLCKINKRPHLKMKRSHLIK